MPFPPFRMCYYSQAALHLPLSLRLPLVSTLQIKAAHKSPTTSRYKPWGRSLPLPSWRSVRELFDRPELSLSVSAHPPTHLRLRRSPPKWGLASIHPWVRGVEMKSDQILLFEKNPWQFRFLYLGWTLVFRKVLESIQTDKKTFLYYSLITHLSHTLTWHYDHNFHRISVLFSTY
jgi:hypothetical protein